MKNKSQCILLGLESCLRSTSSRRTLLPRRPKDDYHNTRDGARKLLLSLTRLCCQTSLPDCRLGQIVLKYLLHQIGDRRELDELDLVPGNNDSSNQERAEVTFLTRVTACLINEKLVNVTHTDGKVVILHPNSTDIKIVSFAENPIPAGFVNSTEFGGGHFPNDVPFRLRGSCRMNFHECWKELDAEQLRLQLQNSART